jgi:acyl transferase domain-containing protein/acyl carrier protein
VVLKRLADAIEDGDTIHAVIKGSAINNDGAVKVGYTAPNVDGQAEVIAMAQVIAGVEPDTITYVEAHGTATPMGDPAEIAALTQVFRTGTARKNFCAIGSVKTNIGHLDAAAGVASLLKTILSLKQRTIPPSLHFEEPNPEIDFAASPFFVNTQLRRWESSQSPRRAGISSFAVGGVNAHVIVEEAPPPSPVAAALPWQLIVLSAKTDSALETATDNLCAHLKQHPDQNFADIAYTLQVGRKGFNHRRALVARDLGDALTALAARDPKRLRTGLKRRDEPAVTFMFSGLGNHYAGMAGELYRTEPTFRHHMEQCRETLRRLVGFDLKELLYPAGRRTDGAAPQPADPTPDVPRSGIDLKRMVRPEAGDDEPLNETRYVHPAMFAVEYSLAQMWVAWGVRPEAMIGYSLGEYTAACLAGVFSLEDALRLIAQRAELIQQLPRGAMLAVPLGEEEVRPLLGEELSLAAVNGESLSVIAGPAAQISSVERQLTERGLACRRLQTTHAFHSKMMIAAFDAFESLAASIELSAPELPFISNVTGTWISPQQATSPRYWAEHMCRTVRFTDGLEELWKQPNRVLLEIGPGQALCAWALQHLAGEGARDVLALPSLRHSFEQYSDREFVLNTVGKLWLAGIGVNWTEVHGAARRRIPLPTYPFETRRYWIEEQSRPAAVQAAEVVPGKEEEIADWFHVPVWKQSPPRISAHVGDEAERNRCWLVFVDEYGVGPRIAERLARGRGDVFTVRSGAGFRRLDGSAYVINPNSEADYHSLLDELRAAGKLPDRIVHAWSVYPPTPAAESEAIERTQVMGFNSLLLLAQALGDEGRAVATHIDILSNNLYDVTGEEDLQPLKATLLGPCKVIPREYPNISCRHVDLMLPARGSGREELFFEQLFAELSAEPADAVIAHRGHHRWLPGYEPVRLEEAATSDTRLREGGVYLITGGVGGIGLVLAERLAQAVRAKLVLTGRSGFPPREQYDEWLTTHPDQDAVSRRIRKIRELERRGAEVLVLSADVTNREAMLDVLRRANETFGRVNGVIHAAGVSPGGLMQVKSLEAAANVMAPKVKGALILDEIFRGQELDFLIFCSSLVAIGGSPGMVDHCAANAFLDAFSHQRGRAGGAFTLSINWDTWLEVGQAADAKLSDSLKDILQAPARKEPGHPLLHQKFVENHGRETHVSLLNTSDNWVLNEHRIKGFGLLPGTAYLEMVRAAFAPHSNGRPVVIENMVFSAPLIVEDGERKEVRTVFEKKKDHFSFAVMERVGTEGAPQWQQRTSGKIGPGASEPRRQHDVRAILERCSLTVVDGEARLEKRNEKSEPGASSGGPIEFGPRWRSLVTRFHLGTGEGLAYVELPEKFAADLESYQLHPALLDAAVGFIQGESEGIYLPLGYRKLTVRGPLPRKIYSYARYVDDGQLSQKETIACDIIVMDEEGNELVEIEEYVVKRLNSVSAFVPAGNGGGQRQSTELAEPPPDIDMRSPQPTDYREAARDAKGILPGEAAEAFTRVLSNALRTPQIAISSRNLPRLLAASRQLTTEKILEELSNLHAQTLKHPRPTMQTTYVAPRTGLEQRLAEIWREMLRLEEVGIHDNLFEIGGDSLMATQLISRISEAFDVELSLRTLFEAPTIAELQMLILRKQLKQTGGEAAAHLVAEIAGLSANELRTRLALEKHPQSENESQ